MLFLLFVGPTEFLLRDVVQSLGNYIQNFIGLSFTVSAYAGEAGVAWQGAWTAFYWGWWISWAPSSASSSRASRAAARCASSSPG